MDVDEGVDVAPIKGTFRINLATKPEDQPLYFDEFNYPHGPGLLFQYVPELTKFDRYTVVETIKRYFYAGLGETAEECADAFQEIVRAYGQLQNTEFANVMAHLYKVVDIALTTQTQVCPIIAKGNYEGVFLKGAGFHLTVQGTEYKAASAEAIDASIKVFDTHAHNLWNIFSKITYATNEERVTAFQNIRAMSSLHAILAKRALIGGTDTRDEVLACAKFLNFPEDRVLEPTAAAIEEVLGVIADPAKPLDSLPSLHYSVLFSTRRAHIAWSAFGSSAPSFRVPDGKVMDLRSSFRVTNAAIKKKDGPAAHRDVTKIGMYLVPLELACTHLDKTISDKTVLNPFGNAVVNASASHITKPYEGESCTRIVAALRKVAQVTVVDEGRKRKNGEGDEGKAERKRGRLDEI